VKREARSVEHTVRAEQDSLDQGKVRVRVKKANGCQAKTKKGGFNQLGETGSRRKTALLLSRGSKSELLSSYGRKEKTILG